ESRGPRLSWAGKPAVMTRRGIQPAKTLANDLVPETLRRRRRGRESRLLPGRALSASGRALPRSVDVVPAGAAGVAERPGGAPADRDHVHADRDDGQIGRASCRERGEKEGGGEERKVSERE